MGNSTDTSNCHFEMFDLLLPYKDEDILIYCPLSYGPYTAYGDSVIKRGKELFGEKFVEHFTQTREWEWRQHAKAVTDWELKRYFEIV